MLPTLIFPLTTRLVELGEPTSWPLLLTSMEMPSMGNWDVVTKFTECPDAVKRIGMPWAWRTSVLAL